jgi:LuxR family maltose regulon positive regulatory protein
LELVTAGGLDDFLEAGILRVLAARLALRDSNRREAQVELTQAARVRPELTHAWPLSSALTLLEMARAYIALDDTGGAREVLRQLRDILRHRPQLDKVGSAVDELERQLDTMRATAVGASSLTAAELRLVPYLPTHLTFPQIAERLYVSRNTTKSQAISVYQKLGVSSRADAVARLEELGLLRR